MQRYQMLGGRLAHCGIGMMPGVRPVIEEKYSTPLKSIGITGSNPILLMNLMPGRASADNAITVVKVIWADTIKLFDKVKFTAKSVVDLTQLAV